MPLATLAAKIDPTGISAPTYNDILQSLIESAQSIFGSDIYLPPDSQDYQLLAVFALAISDMNQTMIASYNGFRPSFAQGAALSSLVKINGLARQPSTSSTAVLVITGTVGTTINNGVVQDSNSNLWNLPAIVIIPIAGTISVTATCQTPGDVVAAPHTITTIFTVILGWQSADNPSAATEGVAMESDAALRRRQAQSTALPSETPVQAILAAVLNVPGVTNAAIYENSSGSTDGNGVPGHSVSLVVAGGSTSAIAQAIEAKKSPGTGTYGTTSITVQDPAGVSITINFFVLVTVPIYVNVTIKALTGFVSATSTAIINEIVAYINSLPIGAKVYYNWILAGAALIGTPQQETFVVTALTDGTSPGPVATADIAIPFNQQASCIAANVFVTVT